DPGPGAARPDVHLQPRLSEESPGESLIVSAVFRLGKPVRLQHDLAQLAWCRGRDGLGTLLPRTARCENDREPGQNRVRPATHVGPSSTPRPGAATLADWDCVISSK